MTVPCCIACNTASPEKVKTNRLNSGGKQQEALYVCGGPRLNRCGKRSQGNFVAHFRFLVRDPQERTSDGKRMCAARMHSARYKSAAKMSDAVTTHEIKEKYSEIGGRLIGDEVKKRSWRQAWRMMLWV